MRIEQIRDFLFGSRLSALIVKETREILRNKYLLFLLLVPPMIQLLILGAALDPQVKDLTLGIVDYSQSRESRDLVKEIVKGEVFGASEELANGDLLARQIELGKIDVGIEIPRSFTTDIRNEKAAPVQVIVDGSNAYSAGLVSSHVLRIVNHFNPESGRVKLPTVVDPRLFTLYNPKLLASWFFLPGVLGATLTLTATLVASACILRERESGTMDQLLMTPAYGGEIVLAKVIPLVVFLLADALLAVAATRVIFALPFRGSLPLFVFSSTMYVLVGIGIGMLLGTLCRSQRQAQLASFFINIPLIQLSGAVVPLDTMPALLQAVSMFDPLRYYAAVARGIILKGVGLDVLWQELLVLSMFAVLALFLSVHLFRRQTA